MFRLPRRYPKRWNSVTFIERSSRICPKMPSWRIIRKCVGSALFENALVAHLFEGKQRRDSAMSQIKRASKGRRPSKTVSVLGIAGMSMAVVADGAAASTNGAIGDVQAQKSSPSQLVTLGEEEISDVSLGTFYVFDKENAPLSRAGVQE